VESHGRAEAVTGIDLTRTVGWLTAISPVVVNGKQQSILDEARRIEVRARSVSRSGLGYGALRWLRRDARLEAQEPAAILFTYLGRFSSHGTWQPAPDAEQRSVFLATPYLLTVNAWMQDERLFVDWWTAGWLPPGSALPAAADALLDRLRSVASDSAPGTGTARRTSTGADPMTATEQVILTAWTEVLDAVAPWNEHLSPAGAAFGIDDDFFLIGGDSIHMIQIASRLRQALGTRVPLWAIRNFPTIRQLATKIDAVVAGTDTF
jgi:aryl carrier-like protein